MKRFLKYAVFYSVILLFIIFNLVLFDSLRYKKPDQEELKPKIVIVSHVYGNPYWTQVRLGAEKAAMERGVVIDFQGPDDASVEESIRLIKMAYAAKASGIITYVQDESYYKDIINEIIEDGIPLVTIDSDAENSKRLAYVGTDNVEAGRVGGREMIR
ncbi:MAG: substrate-binding domain-containing protein, partial [Tissierellales bacterium]